MNWEKHSSVVGSLFFFKRRQRYPMPQWPIKKIERWGKNQPQGIIIKKGPYDPGGDPPPNTHTPWPMAICRAKPNLGRLTLLPRPVQCTITGASDAPQTQASEHREGGFFGCNTGFEPRLVGMPTINHATELSLNLQP